MNNDTTGTIVLTFPGRYMGTRAEVCRDLGPYPGTAADQNVRRLETLHEDLEIRVTDRLATGEGYGCGWGSGKLFPLDEAQLAAVLALHGERVAEEAVRQAEERAALAELDRLDARSTWKRWDGEGWELAEDC